MADAVWGAFVMILVFSLSVAGATAIMKYTEGMHECNFNSDCSDTSYCGSDFRCHSYPVVNKTVVSTDYTMPAAILGLSLVIVAMVLRRKNH